MHKYHILSSMLVSILIWFLGTQLDAAVINCNANAAINLEIIVSLNDQTRLMRVTTNNQDTFSGIANYARTGRDGDQSYYLPVDYTTALQLNIDGRNPDNMLICISNGTCYRCNPN